MATNIIRTVSPSTNQVVCETPETRWDEASSILRASQEAYVSFSSLSHQARKDVVVRALQLFQERKIVLGKELTLQMGRPIAYSHKEIETMQKRADYLLETAEEALKSIPGKPENGFQRWVKKVPIGPILIVFAWNVSPSVLPPETFVFLISSLVPVSDLDQRPHPGFACGEHCHSQAVSSDPARCTASVRDLCRGWTPTQCSPDHPVG